MTTELPEWARPDSQAATPPLDEFRRLYAEDDNLWWRVECGHHQNLFEAACERIDELEQAQRLADSLLTRETGDES